MTLALLLAADVACAHALCDHRLCLKHRNANLVVVE